MMEGVREIMTLEETAKNMTRQGKIPEVRIANQWRFIKNEIEKNLSAIKNPLNIF